jgi:drug/metabolite transporter (DMT)-like permease
MRYFLVLILVNLMWAFQFSGAKIATERLGPITVTLLPLALSTLMLAPFAGFDGRKRNRGGVRFTRGAWISFALVGTVGTIASQLGLTWGVERSLASNAAVLTLTVPVFTAMMASILLGERMNVLRWISFVLAIAGVLLVSDIDWHSVRITEGRYFIGNILLLMSCLGSAFINSYSKKLLTTFSPAEVLVYSFSIADIVLLVLALIYEPGSFSRLSTIGWAAWMSLLAIAAFSLSVSMLLYFWVIEHIDVMQASLSIYLLPVLGVGLSTMLVNEKVTVRLLAGGGLVFASTFLITTLDGRKKAEVAVDA